MQVNSFRWKSRSVGKEDRWRNRVSGVITVSWEIHKVSGEPRSMGDRYQQGAKRNTRNGV